MIKYNKLKDSYRFNKKSVDFFINIGLQITRNCNLRCIHCCEEKRMKDLSFEKIKIIVDKLSRNGCSKICITGGEPLMRDDLMIILKYIHGKIKHITLSTNGLLLDKDKIIKLKPYISNIRFSLHGKEKTHDKITDRQGSFRIIMKNMDIAKKLKIPVSVVASIMSLNYLEIADIGRICEDKGVEKLHLFTLISRGRGSKIYGEQYVSYEKVNAGYKELNDIINKKNWKLQINLVDWNIEGQCVLIFPNGDLVGVPSFKNKDNTKIIGNIFKDSAIALWEKYPFKCNYINYYRNH